MLLWKEIGEGLHALWHTPVLRDMIIFTTIQYSVNQIALRQAMTPRHLLGRVNAGRRFLVFGIMPLGVLLSGLLGSTLDLQPTLIMGAGGLLVAFLWVLFSSIRQVRTFPHVSESD